MIETIESQQLQLLLAKLIHTLRDSNEAYHILSMTKEIPEHCPLDFFHAAGEMDMQRIFLVQHSRPIFNGGNRRGLLFGSKDD
ncbi:hypothetical protein RWE15_00260 [Virgibacillus halophilus]|uniref:Uncharacterized protein n=1 Tax=Tigheibacillus halophilus TaxID=361280 RepID=A0ABU5C1G7_9BACI|nr:hypothetical protein [Virgibacillus halophilus]